MGLTPREIDEMEIWYEQQCEIIELKKKLRKCEEAK